MARQAPRPPSYQEVDVTPKKVRRHDWMPGIISSTHDEPDVIEGHEPSPNGCRFLFFGMMAFWIAVIVGVMLLYSCQAKAGMLHFLESERDLGNGYKLCIYSQGVTITRPSYQLCPISIEV